MRNLTQNTQYSMGIQIYFYLKLMKMTWNLFINSIFNYFYITYLKILKPIYLLNIHLQRDYSSLGEIIPAILNFIIKLEIIKLTPKLSLSWCIWVWVWVHYPYPIPNFFWVYMYVRK
jgi:hypothetical protein